MKYNKIEERSKLFQEVINACSFILKNDSIADSARNYLNNRLPIERQEKYQFGFFPQNDNLHDLISLLGKDLLTQLTLIYPKYVSGGSKLRGHFHNHNLIMPFRDAYGNIIAILGRTLYSAEEQESLQIQKYKYSFGAHKDMYVYGLECAKQAIIENDCAIGVEGQFDAIACHEANIKNTVAFGWANMTRFQFFTLRKYTKNFILLLDNDEAGKRAKNKLKNKYRKYANIIGANVPEPYKDIDECLRIDSNKDSIIKWLKELSCKGANG